MKLLNIRCSLSANKGFTLLEAALYSGLLALFLTTTFVFVNSILGTTGRISERNEIVVNEELVERKLSWLVSQATGVSLPAANATGTTLTLTGSDSSIYPATFSISNQQVLLSLANGTAVPITNARVKATTFSITDILTSSSLQAIRVSLSLQSAALSTITSSLNFSNALP